MLRIERIYYRNDPILCVARPGRPPTDYSLSKGMIRAAQLWDRVEKAGLPNVKGVWSLESGIGSLFNVISIKQAYPGHSRQALFLASQSLGGAYNGRFVVVVDEDIDPTSEFDVLWAMSTRCDPETSRRNHPPRRQRFARRLHSAREQRPQLALPDRRLHALRPAPPISTDCRIERRTKKPNPREMA